MPDHTAAQQNWKIARTPFQLSGKTLIITGAGGGLGAALAAEALARGANLALTDHALDRLENVARTLNAPNRISLHQADLTDRSVPTALIADIIQQHGKIDVLINNAGMSMAGKFTDSNIEQFDQIIQINLWAVAALIYASLPHLKPGAHIINISSMSGLVGMPFSAAYSASKFGQRGLSETLMTELPWQGIGVTSVHPGGINTGLAKRMVYSEKASQKDLTDLQNASTKSMKTTSAERTATLTLNAAQRRKSKLIVGPDAKAMDFAARLAPNSLWKILAKAVNR